MAGQAGGVNPGDDIAGFRLVRLLGSGTRSRVYLGHANGQSVAVKLYRASATGESIDDEIAALSSASHAHVVSLREVGSAPSGLPFLVLERLESATIGGILLARRPLSAGEAVTMLAPVVAAVGALHSSGVAHGSIAPGRVQFRATGAPVLAGFGRARLFVPPTSAAMLSSSRPVLEDRLALGRLVRSVVSQLGDEHRDLSTWLASLERDGFPDEYTDALLERVFSLGQATPVRFSRPEAPQGPSAAGPVAQQAVTQQAPPARTRLVDFARSRLPAAVSIDTVVAQARSVRRPVWVAAGLGVGALVAALLLVPPPQGGVTAQPDAPATTPSSAPALSDDPVEALSALLDERERCVRDLSVICLENVAQSGSAALDDDVQLIRSIEAGETTGVLASPSAGSIQLSERHGDVALLAYSVGQESEPASVLLAKGEAGWRIRDYLAN